MRALGTPLRRFVGGQSGQSLVIVSLSMVAMLGMAALGIDVGNWYQKHHQTQVVADAAALAAANCLASPNVGATGSICTSSTDVTDATAVAIAYAAANGVTITKSDVTVNTTKDIVTVTASAGAPVFFAKLLGIHTSTQSADAGASWTGSSGACSNPGTGCDFIFADNSNCSSSSNGISFTSSGTSTISGNIQSNGNISGAKSGTASWGTASYGPNGTSTCKNSLTYSGNDPWSTAPTQATADAPYPIDYTKDFPACGGSGELACASNGYPTFCTNAAASITFTGSGGASGDAPVSGNIYCASGTGSKSTPSTWNGAISDTSSGGGTWSDSFVGGTVTFTTSGTTTFSSCGYSKSGYTASACSASVPAPATSNYPIVYATSSSTAISNTASGYLNLNGDLFAPNGSIHLTLSGSEPLVTFIEGLNVSATISGTFEGDGPTGGTTTSGSPGVDSLVQ